jgi:hypothetical protein
MHVAILYAGSISRDSSTSERVLQIANGLADRGTQVTFSEAIGDRVKAPNLKLASGFAFFLSHS